MASRTIVSTTEQAVFRTVGRTGVFISETPADHKGSMSILQQNGLRLLTYQEALVKLCQDQELKEQLKGNWFYLAGEGTALSGYYTIDDKGELTAGKGGMEKTVYVWKGQQPLSLYVHMDDFSRVNERRFAFYANFKPTDVAPMVIGVRIGHEAAAQNIEAPRGQPAAELKKECRKAAAGARRRT